MPSRRGLMPHIRSRWVLVLLLALSASMALGFFQNYGYPQPSMRNQPSKPPPSPVLSQLTFPTPTRQPALRQLVAGSIHVYEVTIKPGHFLEMRVEQLGVDLQVSVFAPGGQPFFTMDSPIGDNGSEVVRLVAASSAPYRFEVSGRKKKNFGPYRIWVAADRPATPGDQKEVEAEALYQQANEPPRNGDRSSSEVKLLRASKLWGEVKNYRRQPDAFVKLGEIYAARWDWKASLQVRLRAESLYRQTHQFIYLAGLANDLGSTRERLLDFEGARRDYENALSLGRRYGNAPALAAAHHNLGNLARILARSAEALKNLEQADQEWKLLGNREEDEAKTLTAMGLVFASAQRIDLARAKFNQALAILGKTKYSRQRAITLSQLGNVYLGLGAPDRARSFYLEALKIQRQIRDLGSLAATLNGIGLAFLHQRRYQEALGPFLEALQIYEQKSDPLYQARTLTNLGWVYASLGRNDDAGRAFERAQALAKRKDPWAEAAAAFGLARLEEARGNPIAAERQAKAAVATAEIVRATLNRDLRTSYFSGRQDLYDALIEILLWRHEINPGRGYSAQAFGVSEKARSRSLLDTISSSRTGQSRDDSPLVSSLSLAEIQRSLLDPQTLFLEYHLGKKASEVWIVDQNSFEHLRLPPREQIEALAARTHELLVQSARRERLGQARRAAMAFSRMLIGPATPWLGQKRLVISVPPALQGIPFSVLPDPSARNAGGPWPKPLVIDHEIVKVPSAAVLMGLRAREHARPVPRKLLAVLASPAFGPDDTGAVGTSFQSSSHIGEALLFGPFRPLTFARKEAEAVLREATGGETFAAYGFDATRQLVLSGRLRDFRNLHFATHGLLSTEDADLSALVLALVDRSGRPQNGILRASDIRNLEIPADLVVLSACETGLGQNIPGEGLVGLPQAFFAAGATRVLVSLWAVNDLSTSRLMQHFYHEYLGRGLSPSAALREAQKAMWQSPGRSAPFHWGAFEVQGDWKPVFSRR
jgi:CHAT domain-containing protein/tetratricopeptide (TPR) repeat protein